MIKTKIKSTASYLISEIILVSILMIFFSLFKLEQEFSFILSFLIANIAIYFFEIYVIRI